MFSILYCPGEVEVRRPRQQDWLGGVEVVADADGEVQDRLAGNAGRILVSRPLLSARAKSCADSFRSGARIYN